MHAWGESSEVFVCAGCGTCCDAEGWQVPRLVDMLFRTEVFSQLSRPYRQWFRKLLNKE